MLSYVANMLTSLQFMLTYVAQIKMAEASPATSRHSHHKRGLLSSESDPVHKLVLRENQGGLHRTIKPSIAQFKMIMWDLNM